MDQTKSLQQSETQEVEFITLTDDQLLQIGGGIGETILVKG
jgi:hypothetical protein